MGKVGHIAVRWNNNQLAVSSLVLSELWLAHTGHLLSFRALSICSLFAPQSGFFVVIINMGMRGLVR